MEATLELTQPYIDPPNTFRATMVEQMYSFSASGPFTAIYDIGLPPQWVQRFAIRNNTVSNVLQFEFVFPQFVQTAGARFARLEPMGTYWFDLTINEPLAKQFGKSRIKDYFDTMKISATPMGITGPVFVRRDLPSFLFHHG